MRPEMADEKLVRGSSVVSVKCVEGLRSDGDEEIEIVEDRNARSRRQQS